MPKLVRPDRDKINEYRRRLHERAEAGALRYPFVIQEIRKTMGLTQQQFARVFNLTRRQVAEMERNEANPTVETLNKLGQAWGFTVGFVLKKPQEDEPPSPFEELPMQKRKAT